MFWDPVPNAIDWYTTMDKGDGHVMIRLKQMLQRGLRMIRINENNKLPINVIKKCYQFRCYEDRWWRHEWKIEEIHKREKFNKEFDICIVSEYQYDEAQVIMKRKAVIKRMACSSNVFLVVTSLLYEHNSETINLLYLFLNKIHKQTVITWILI